VYFFTGDEHFSHKNILKYCGRPFPTIEDHDEEIIKRHNEVVKKNDIVVHSGDFTMKSSFKEVSEYYINRLNGTHIFLKGSHDKWLNQSKSHEIWEKTIYGQHIVVCHYAMLVWPRSHYGSWQLFGHSHGNLNHPLMGKQHDDGVDNNNFYPFSLDQIVEIMKNKPNNFNLLKNHGIIIEPLEIIKTQQISG